MTQRDRSAAKTGKQKAQKQHKLQEENCCWKQLLPQLLLSTTATAADAATFVGNRYCGQYQMLRLLLTTAALAT